MLLQMRFILLTDLVEAVFNQMIMSMDEKDTEVVLMEFCKD